MTAPLHLDSLFPSLDAIPEQYRPDAPIEQRDYLVDGQLRHWDGPLAPVRSPVFLAEADGERQVILGSTPLLDANAALARNSTAAPAVSNWNRAPSARSAGFRWAWRCAWGRTTTR